MAGKLSMTECNENSMRQAEAELLEALLKYQESPYPWNPADPEAEAYFASLEEFELEGLSEEEMKKRSQSFFAQIDQCWTNTEQVDEVLKASLSKKFANCVPQAWLDAIAQGAKQVFSSNLSLAEQLVQCVRPVLQNWAEEDLLVFARPLAYAMRGTSLEAVESESLIKPGDWTELTEMERARLSMLIARYALKELET